MKRFNVTGVCRPDVHYMVKLDNRLERIKRLLVERKKYFVINRGRQYGKTTTLRALEKYLMDEYIVLSLDFQQLGTKDFADEATFSDAFADIMIRAFHINNTDDSEELLKPLSGIRAEGSIGLKDLFVRLSDVCRNSPRPMVLMIDEVDSASNNQVFVDFLAQLRSYYLYRDKMPIFHSVILAGVYSIKNLKLKLRQESEHQYNSPWNIAADFDINMSLSRKGIEGMLREYEADHAVGMDPEEMAGLLYRYTSGYPFLVSRLCKLMDEKTDPETAWTKEGFLEAIKPGLFLTS